jgi:hypothetical protein
MNLKTTIQATEITEDTEMKRILQFSPIHLIGEDNVYAISSFSSVNSVFSVANRGN